MKWVEVGAKRYSPRKILQNYKSKNNQRFAGLIPVISVEKLEKIAFKLSAEFNKVSEIFDCFSFGNRITDLSSEDFYALMLKLPLIEFSSGTELSKAIYRIVEQPTCKKSFGDSESKDRFFEEGKVLVKHQGQLQYVLAKKAFLPSSKIISKKCSYS